MVPFYVIRIKKEKHWAAIKETIKEESNIKTVYMSAECLPRMIDMEEHEHKMHLRTRKYFTNIQHGAKKTNASVAHIWTKKLFRESFSYFWFIPSLDSFQGATRAYDSPALQRLKSAV